MTTPPNGNLRAAAAQRAQQVQQPANGTKSKEVVLTRGDEVELLFEGQRKAMAKALPNHLTVDRMIKIGLTTIRRTPRLAQCTDLSLIGAMMLSVQLGLEPGPLGHCWWLPFKDGKRTRAAGHDVYEVQWIIGYTGIIELARRSGNLRTITAKAVRTNDRFDFEDGIRPSVSFRKCLDGPRGDLYCVWGGAEFADGGQYLDMLTRDEVYTQHRDRSKAWQNALRFNKADTPWHTDEEAMWRKTMVRAMRPWLPASVEMAAAFAADEKVHHETSFDLDLLADRVVDEDIQDAEVVEGEVDGESARQNGAEAAPATGAGQWADRSEAGA